MTLRREEMLVEVSVPANTADVSGEITLSLASFPWLSVVSSSFERYRWRRLTLHWRSAGGLNKGGLMALGVDWASQVKLTTGGEKSARQKVLALTPHLSMPISAAGDTRSLRLPPSMLNSRKWYVASKTDEEGSVGSCRYAVKSDSDTTARFIGEIWADYEILLQGTRA